jgi:hypothetical protein
MIYIEITGPGQTFSDVLELIKETLEKEGATVVVKDDYPNPRTSDAPKLYPNRHIEIKTNHAPWGG